MVFPSDISAAARVRRESGGREQEEMNTAIASMTSDLYTAGSVPPFALVDAPGSVKVAATGESSVRRSAEG